MISTKTEGLDIKFGPFPVTKQPRLRLTDLSPAETADLFATVQLAQKMLARAYFKTPEPKAGSFTIAVQDGPDAGQTVPHLHVHVIPRVKDDLGEGVPLDEVYVKMAGEEGNVGGALWDVATGAAGQRPKPGGGMPRIEDVDRNVRTAEQMYEEADRYKTIIDKMGEGGNV
ncbi:Dinucleoside triphosphate hydrolase [Lecanicillium sp. MT-2017a]|nr:Dinucleoside triphosphate hydrolase [Lecanicillium sp. MT-2017a]